MPTKEAVRPQPTYEPDLYLCTKCKKMKPLGMFLLDRDCCRECHNRQQREHRASVGQKERGKRFCKLSRNISRKRAPEAMLGIVEAVAEECGGMKRLVAEWSKHLQTATPSRRMAGIKTLLHVVTVCESFMQSEEAAKTPEETQTPEQIIRELHQSGRLTPILKVLYAEGRLSLNDIDPPGEDPI